MTARAVRNGPECMSGRRQVCWARPVGVRPHAVAAGRSAREMAAEVRVSAGDGRLERERAWEMAAKARASAGDGRLERERAWERGRGHGQEQGRGRAGRMAAAMRRKAHGIAGARCKLFRSSPSRTTVVSCASMEAYTSSLS